MDRFGDRIYMPTLHFLLRYPLLGLGRWPGSAIHYRRRGAKRATSRSIHFPSPIATKSWRKSSIPTALRRGWPTKPQRASNARCAKSANNSTKDKAKASAIEAEGGATHGPVKLTFRQVGQMTAQGPMRSANGGNGSNVGQVFVELRDSTERNITSTELINLWRKEAGEFNGAELVRFDSASVGPGGQPIEFKLLAPASHQAELDQAVEDVKAYLGTFTGVYDIRDDATPGKLEFQIRVKDRAQVDGGHLGRLGRNHSQRLLRCRSHAAATRAARSQIDGSLSGRRTQ